ncbi:AtuA-related protein [Actinoalloteichus hymeniacidonis]|uniref:AtuA-like ferredoxin-fold domain-containing protein n=1 Tax=Actinoalloteichus hymeniacidonis TaxID=340345 RepID=A0AAC9HS67_9PSEU|nr:hypothetical protein [Actinoalloteichus hymeniacidonis]AOS64627.1 hypothetical protein TL08_19180 [Actinoalloteichus hymeniacidonis]MBB5907300.1 hypothetical protein [Actinoalloteichus hymeniacidonis]
MTAADRTLDEFADVRAGDKGDTLIVGVFPRRAEDFALLVESLTPERVAAHYGALVTGEVRRTALENLPALVFELPGVLGGGVTGSPVLDGHGKTLGYHLLTLAV